MKNLLSSLSLFLSLSLTAQKLQNHALYLTAGMNLTADGYQGISSSVQYMFKEKYAIKYGDSGNTRVPDNLPHDYRGGLFSFGKPKESFSMKYVTVGYVIKPKSSHLIRLNVSAGVAKFSEKTYTEWTPTDGGIFGSNYHREANYLSGLGLFVNPAVELPFGRGIGMSISPYMLIGPKFQSFGCSFNVMVGLLRGKYK